MDGLQLFFPFCRLSYNFNSFICFAKVSQFDTPKPLISFMNTFFKHRELLLIFYMLFLYPETLLDLSLLAGFWWSPQGFLRVLKSGAPQIEKIVCIPIVLTFVSVSLSSGTSYDVH